MGPEARKRIWVDAFQTRMTERIVLYFATFVLVTLNLLFAWRLWREGPHDLLAQFNATIYDHLPALTCVLLLAPVMIWDAVHFTHRVAGPVVRLRQTMSAIARGEAVQPVRLREGDYLGGLRDDFNAMLESLQKRGVPVLKPLQDDTQQERSHSA